MRVADWPVTKARQEWKNVPVRQAIEVKEGAATYTRLERKAYVLGTRPARAATKAKPKAAP